MLRALLIGLESIQGVRVLSLLLSKELEMSYSLRGFFLNLLQRRPGFFFLQMHVSRRFFVGHIPKLLF
jgi:hypothetical protein